jgi:hypothetical protein
MSAFNVLKANVHCSNCNTFYEASIQFKYGDIWQLKYRVGDKIKWGGNDIGKPNMHKAKVYGILEEDKCKNCGEINSINEFDIYLKDDVIIEVKPMENITEYFSTEGNYFVIEA